MRKSICRYALPALLLACACNSNTSRQHKTVEGYIPKDTADLMTSSYVRSLPLAAEGQAPDVHYWTMNADLLRDYLSNPLMKGIKILLAHNLDYIHSGHEGQPAGYRSDALSIVLNGYDSSGIILYGPPPGATVPNHALPCPYNCILPAPGGGTPTK